MSFLFVALGGAIGAMARYAISLIPVKTGFPILTLITNIAGAILIGFIVGFTSNKDNISGNTVLFWKTGVCGGLYIVLSVVCCIFGILCGNRLASVVKLWILKIMSVIMQRKSFL